MDKLDSDILEYLTQDCRISSSKLAKKLNKPRHIVEYHRKKLEKDKVIKGNEVILDYSALGYSEYIIYLKLHRYLIIKKELTEYIKALPNARWFSELFPNYNLRIAIVVKDIQELQRTIDKIEKKCGDHLMKKEILVNREFLKIEPHTTLTNSNVTNTPESILKLNKEDKELLKSLSKDPTAPLLQLATESGVSIEAVRQKIIRFKESHFLKGLISKINIEKTGQNFYCVLLIRLNNIENHLNKLHSFLYSTAKFGKTRRTMGKWNIELTAYASSYKTLIERISALEKLL